MIEDSKLIAEARSRFDADLHSAEYRRVHSDQAHLEALLAVADFKACKSCLDLGTGNGYVAFELAKRYPQLRVTGLDIAQAAIVRDNELAREGEIANASFVAYDGTLFPFPDGAFDAVVCRYSFHHYPRPADSISQIRRVLSPQGFFLLSDPLAYDEDSGGFIDELQRLRPDGHVHYYGRKEIEELCRAEGLTVEAEFASSIRYPRRYDGRYRELFARTDPELLKLYEIESSGDEVYVTVSVMNIVFRLLELE